MEPEPDEQMEFQDQPRDSILGSLRIDQKFDFDEHVFSEQISECESLVDEILNESKNIDEIVDQLENCGCCSTMLINLINDLMDLAKIDRIKFSLNNSYFDLENTINAAFKTLGFFSKQKKIYPTLSINEEIKPYFKNLLGD